MTNETITAADVTPVLFPSDKARFILLYNIARLNRWYATLLSDPQESGTVLDIARDMNTAGHMQVSLSTAGGVTEQEVRWLIERMEANDLVPRDMSDVMVHIVNGNFGL